MTHKRSGSRHNEEGGSRSEHEGRGGAYDGEVSCHLWTRVRGPEWMGVVRSEDARR